MTGQLESSGVRGASRLRQLQGRFGAVILLTLASQVLSATSTLVLPVLGLDVADTYAIAAQVGLASVTGVSLGVVYNLAIGRPSFSSWRTWTVIAALFSFAVCLGQYFILSASGAIQGDARYVLAVFLAFAVGGACLSATGIRAVREACGGRPRRLAGMTLVPNALLMVCVIILGIAHVRGPIAMVLPAVGWAIAGACCLAESMWRGERIAALEVTPVASGERANRRIHTVALIIGVVSSSIIPAIVIGAATGLGAGIPYVLALASKLGNAIVSLGVNSVLMARYSWNSGGLRSTRGVEGIVVAGCASAAIALATSGSTVASLASACVAWLCVIVASAIVVRELNARAVGSLVFLKAILDVIFAGSGALFFMNHPSAPGFFACFMLSAGVSIAVGSVGMRAWRLSCLGLLTIAFAIAILLGGL